MASLPARTTASFDAIKPVSSLVLLDDELNDMKGAAGFLNGGTTAKKLLIKTSDGSDPPVDCDQIGAGLLARWKQNGSNKVTLSNAGLFTMVNTAVNTGFNADQVDGIEGANIAKLDTNVAAWSMTWSIDDPSTFTLSDDTLLPVWLVPAGTSIAITKIKVVYYSGSHTAGGSVTFAHTKRNSAGAGAAFVTGISLDNTNNTIRTTYSANFSVALSEGDQIACSISARSGTVSERKVSIVLCGTQKLT